MLTGVSAAAAIEKYIYYTFYITHVSCMNEYADISHQLWWVFFADCPIIILNYPADQDYCRF